MDLKMCFYVISKITIFSRVKNPEPGEPWMRPNLELLRDICNSAVNHNHHQAEVEVPEVVISLMPECWAEDPDARQVCQVLNSSVMVGSGCQASLPSAEQFSNGRIRMTGKFAEC
jgi:hypothetical protein